MKSTVETPSQLIERLEVMGLDRARRLLALNHFEPKAHGLVKGWIKRKEEEARVPEPESKPQKETPPAAPLPDAAEIQESIRLSNRAIREAQSIARALAQTRKLANIALGTAVMAIVVAILALFALALK